MRPTLAEQTARSVLVTMIGKQGGQCAPGSGLTRIKHTLKGALCRREVPDACADLATHTLAQFRIGRHIRRQHPEIDLGRAIRHRSIIGRMWRIHMRTDEPRLWQRPDQPNDPLRNHIGLVAADATESVLPGSVDPRIVDQKPAIPAPPKVESAAMQRIDRTSCMRLADQRRGRVTDAELPLADVRD